MVSHEFKVIYCAYIIKSIIQDLYRQLFMLAVKINSILFNDYLAIDQLRKVYRCPFKQPKAALEER